MIITKTIPESTMDMTIEKINFDVVEKTASCIIVSDNPDVQPYAVVVDLNEPLAAATVTQRTTIKNFFKWIMAQGFVVAESELPDTVFD